MTRAAWPAGWAQARRLLSRDQTTFTPCFCLPQGQGPVWPNSGPSVAFAVSTISPLPCRLALAAWVPLLQWLLGTQAPGLKGGRYRDEPTCLNTGNPLSHLSPTLPFPTRKPAARTLGPCLTATWSLGRTSTWGKCTNTVQRSEIAWPRDPTACIWRRLKSSCVLLETGSSLPIGAALQVTRPVAPTGLNPLLSFRATASGL